MAAPNRKRSWRRAAIGRWSLVLLMILASASVVGASDANAATMSCNDRGYLTAALSAQESANAAVAAQSMSFNLTKGLHLSQLALTQIEVAPAACSPILVAHRVDFTDEFVSMVEAFQKAKHGDYHGASLLLKRAAHDQTHANGLIAKARAGL
jgi:hypothetical protein